MINSYTTTAAQGQACFCMGPQNGEPLCPCRMRSVRIVDGRYQIITDHGPVNRMVEFPRCKNCNSIAAGNYCSNCGEPLAAGMDAEMEE